MRQPAGGCFDGAGNLIVSDSKAKKIMCFGTKGDFLGNLEIFGNDGGGYLESLPSRMTDISINDQGYLIILTPLPLGGGRDRQDRGRSGCKKSILRCKINSPEENPSDPMSRTVNGVTTKMVGSIFEEVTDVQIKEPEPEPVQPDNSKSDFDREYDDMARDTGFDDNRSQSSDRGSDRGGFRGSFRGGFRGRGAARGGIRESQRPASSSWCTKPQSKPAFLQDNGAKKWDNYDNKWNKTKSRSNSRDRFSGSHNSRSPTRSPPRGGGNWGSSPKASGGGGAGWGNSPNNSPKASGGGAGWGNSPNNSPKASGGGGWGDSPEEKKDAGAGWGVSGGSPKDSPKPSGGGAWGASKSPTRTDGGGGWGATKSPIQTGGAWGNTANDQPTSKCPVLKGGWGDSPEAKPSGGGGWGDSPEEKKDSGSGWGVSDQNRPLEEPTPSGWGGSSNTGEFDESTSAITDSSVLGAPNNSWNSVVKPPELQDGWGKEADKQPSNNSGWGGKTNESPVNVSASGGWGSGSPAKEATPPKPCLVVNKPPVEAAIDTKNDPRMKPKRRISMAGTIL